MAHLEILEFSTYHTSETQKTIGTALLAFYRNDYKDKTFKQNFLKSCLSLENMYTCNITETNCLIISCNYDSNPPQPWLSPINKAHMDQFLFFLGQK